MRIAPPLVALAALSAGCGEKENSCDEYVAYICDCYPDNCEQTETTYADSDAAQQEQCAIALADAQEADEQNGQECSGGEDTAVSR